MSEYRENHHLGRPIENMLCRAAAPVSSAALVLTLEMGTLVGGKSRDFNPRAPRFITSIEWSDRLLFLGQLKSKLVQMRSETIRLEPMQYTRCHREHVHVL